MRLLFIHQNFPGQYPNLTRYLHAQGGHQIVGLGEVKNIKDRGVIQGITTYGYPTPKEAGGQTHPYIQPLEAAVRRGQAAARALLEIKGKGFVPDVISLHPGWGEGLFVRDVFPDTPILMLCEYYFHSGEADLAFDPEFPRSMDWNFSVRLRNSPQIISLLTASACISPTNWQASRYPDFVRERIRIIHDGINTAYMKPDPDATITIQPLQTPGESRVVAPGRAPGNQEDAGEVPMGNPIVLGKKDKVITYVSRNLEPYRGFHVFLRALPEVQRQHPDAHILIVGNAGTSYSPTLAPEESYKEKYLAELRGSLDMSRIHFLGRVAYPALRALFQVSTAHVYFTYPFVLSWSALEAMSCGCLLIASRTAPVEEVVTDGENGVLVDFFDTHALAEAVNTALSDREAFRAVRERARESVLERYELQACLGQQAALLEELAGTKR